MHISKKKKKNLQVKRRLCYITKSKKGKEKNKTRMFSRKYLFMA